MATTELTGRINEAGQIELDHPTKLLPGAVRIIIEPLDPDQAYFWTKEWQEGERKAEEEMAAGEYKDFPTIEDFLDDLFDDES
jgi:hypothetical protein